MIKKVALFSALAACMGSTYAYQAEVGVGFDYYDPDYGDSAQNYSIDGKYHFNPVEAKNNPLNEAAFLSRSSNINGKYSYFDADYYNVHEFNVGVEYFVPNSNFYVSAGLGHFIEKDEYWDEKYNETTYQAEVGYLPIDGLLLAAGLAGYSGDYDDDIDPTLRAKYVTPVGNFDMNFEANARFGDDNFYGIGTDLYLNKTLSVGLAYTDTDDDNVYTIRAKKYLNQSISLEGKIEFNDNYNVYGARLAYFF
ncbi:putative porin [Acinetobacter sp. 194]|uniref:putative porin n=1 Tax=Acinetobacter shaoyimingii TaxID=2715164 RepID=UPI00140B123C|nr:putative porin [Acinetobacter shaoyimingii]NHB56854.1 putative porin [Acinetobacter shaoyimingii]